ncbi:MAG: MBL fold metallo-hydrolase [Bacteroidota bacterium]|nr:MBL fold metallo-hydrolase [Bacteroidota bacterium]MDP3144468.1 MBL fold metallo-hydrolase [Bacteroidota bacterium]
MFLLLSFYKAKSQKQQPFVLVLGIAQDGGYPHLGCEKKCCDIAWKNDSLKKNTVSLALVDPETKSWWLFEATPDIKEQLNLFKSLTDGGYNYLPTGIFITHAHIGHYTGLMQLGREVLNSAEVPVYTLPKMKLFLETNGPWSQLVSLKNIQLFNLSQDSILKLNSQISIITFTVPHRDEFSETAGFKIITSSKKYLFIPDIDKWQKWDKNIIKEVEKVDVAFLDATFNDLSELKNRKIDEVPHPFISETIDLFKNTDTKIKSKLYFIHFNHTNPMLWDTLSQQTIQKKGYKLSKQGEKL